MPAIPSTTAQPKKANPLSWLGNLSSSYKVWAVLMAYLVLVKLIITLSPATFRSAEQAAVFGWPFLAVWTAAGLIGIWFSRRTGFPDAWDARISNRQRFLIPILIGLAFSVVAVSHDLVTHYTQLLSVIHGQVRNNIDFPASLLIYPGGAVIVEVFYRLFAIPVLLWLISNVILKKRYQALVFWILAILTSFIEPATQDLEISRFGTLLIPPCSSRTML